MTKFNPEHPTISMVVERKNEQGGIRLCPADGYAEEALNQLPYGTAVEIKFYQRRSYPKLKLYWSVLGTCVKNGDKYGTAENLHDVIKITLGYCRRVKAIGVGPAAQLIDSCILLMRGCWKAANSANKALRDVINMGPLLLGLEQIAAKLNELKEIVGDTIVLPGSISFAKMSTADFDVYFDKAMLQLEAAGYPISDILKEVERTQKRVPFGGSYGRSQTPRGGNRGIEGEGSEGQQAA